MCWVARPPCEFGLQGGAHLLHCDAKAAGVGLGTLPVHRVALRLGDPRE